MIVRYDRSWVGDRSSIMLIVAGGDWATELLTKEYVSKVMHHANDSVTITIKGGFADLWQCVSFIGKDNVKWICLGIHGVTTADVVTARQAAEVQHLIKDDHLVYFTSSKIEFPLASDIQKIGYELSDCSHKCVLYIPEDAILALDLMTGTKYATMNVPGFKLLNREEILAPDWVLDADLAFYQFWEGNSKSQQIVDASCFR